MSGAENIWKRQFLKKGAASDEDIEIAARLYAIQCYEKIRISPKRLTKPIPFVKKRIQETGEEVTDVDDDWIMYFMDRASNISRRGHSICLYFNSGMLQKRFHTESNDRPFSPLTRQKSARLFATPMSN